MPVTIYVKRARNSVSMFAQHFPLGARHAYCQEMHSVLSPLLLILTTRRPCLLARQSTEAGKMRIDGGDER